MLKIVVCCDKIFIIYLGVIVMSEAMEVLIQEEVREEKVKTVLRMNKVGKSSVEEMGYLVELPINQVQEILETLYAISM